MNKRPHSTAKPSVRDEVIEPASRALVLTEAQKARERFFEHGARNRNYSPNEKDEYDADE